MQDRAQKALALRYAVAKRWLPQLELDVSTYITIAKTPTTITDIDVYASVPDDFVGFRIVVLDCKTRRGESPITRAMWQRGLMDRLGADRGICLLRVPRIEPDHRYTAAQLGVTLLAESEFQAFTTATAPGHKSAQGAIAEIERWDEFFGVAKRFRPLEPAIRFSRSGFWMSENEAEACTRTIFLALSLRAELDPDKPEHIAVVADLAALFTHALARIVVRVFAAYLQPGQQDDLSRALLYFLYGGRSSYEHLNRIRKMLAESRAPAGNRTPVAAENEPNADWPSLSQAKQDADSGVATGADKSPLVDARVQPPVGGQRNRDLSLPEWKRFVELVRQMLDAPLEVNRAPLILREIGWAAFGAGTKSGNGVTPFARTLATASPQGARFATLALEYLCQAARLPREFALVLTGRLLAAQTK